jgi:hypothetical protein
MLIELNEGRRLQKVTKKHNGRLPKQKNIHHQFFLIVYNILQAQLKKRLLIIKCCGQRSCHDTRAKFKVKNNSTAPPNVLVQ